MKVSTDEATLREYSRDAGPVVIQPQMVYTAESEEEVVRVLEDSRERQLPVTPRGGGTGIPTQSVGRGAILVQNRREIGLQGSDVVCQPGVVKSELNGLLARSGRWIPVDPSSYASATVGGMVSNNSSGARTIKYGSTADFVIGLRVVVPGEGAGPIQATGVDEAISKGGKLGKAASLILENQDLIVGEKPMVTKNSSGYRLEKVIHDGLADLPKLFVGSEGTLGVVTEATFKTSVKPTNRVLFIVEASEGELGPISEALRGLLPSALELVDKSVFLATGRWEKISKYSKSEAPYLVFCEIEGADGDVSQVLAEVAESKAASFDPTVVSSQSEIAQAWETRGETLVIAQEFRRGGRTLVPGVEDLVVPPDRLRDLVRLLVDEFGKRGLEYIMYGHAGDANLHARPFIDLSAPAGVRALEDLMEDCFAKVWKMGGSMTGEHGDGMLRAKFVERQYPKTFWIMEELKRLYDPKNLLNPGVKISSA